MPFADWWSRKTAPTCQGCGEPVPALARSCAHCGARNRARRVWLAVAVLVPVLVLALGILSIVVPRLPLPSTAPPDFAWLKNAMQDCDAEATKQQGALYFLVIPLAAKAEDEGRWRSKSRDEVGNAILLGTDDALEGLRSRGLRLSAENYGFNVRDGANVLYQWTSSSGVTRLTIPDADAIEMFNIQFQTDRQKSDTAWGSVFSRKRGNCYWVSAIIGT
jgi:hypothetical protein